ncbi:MAG TPA: M50 family metallopeptidase [Candidatus Limnocylindrales bacterium]|nr:M50 family metallopeptidase [Candidatus Limnocylindrales bacterium]
MTGIIDTIVTILLFIIVLGGLVLFHELGHFITARIARVRVLEFGVGFPPRAKALGSGGVSAKDVEQYRAAREAAIAASGEDEAAHEALLETPENPPGTVYTLNWLPIGGFVKLEDENGEDGFDPRSFGRARLPVKLVILIAGVVMNLLLALAIFTSIAWFATPYIGLKFDSVEVGSPADQAGLVGGDAIVSVDGQQYDFFSSYDDTSPIDGLRSHAGETIVLGVLHADDTTSEVTVTLRTQAELEAGKGALGIKAAETGFEFVFLPEYTGRPLPEALSIGWNETMRWFGLILEGLGSLVGSIVSNPTGQPPVSGPIGIATSLGDTFRDSGIVMTLYVAGILSANLALVNFLPFPPLDGGRMLMLLLKAIPRYGKKISLRAEQATYAVGFVALFAFLIWITVFDIARQVGGGTP